MAFTDDFTGTDGDYLKDRTGWADNTAGIGSAILSNGLKHTAGSDQYYKCTSQASADHYTQAKFVYFGGSQQGSYIACRLTDNNNFVGARIYGTGTSGRRLTETYLGTEYDLVTTQGAANEWVKVECQGSTARLYLGGTGGTPSWTQSGTDQTISGSTTEQRQGVTSDLRSTDTTVWIDDFEAGSLSSGVSVNAELVKPKIVQANQASIFLNQLTG